jgi:RNA polymerase sigma-54 factor
MFEMSLSAEMSMRVTPALLNLAHMLTLPSFELAQLVQQELDQNPALEELDLPDESDLTDYHQLMRERVRQEYLDDGGDLAEAPPGDELPDPLLFVAAPGTLAESLLADLRASLPASDHAIALMLVGSLDEWGFLSEPPEQIATLLHLDETRVQAVLQRLRELGPPGIGALNLRDCLLAQLDALEAAGTTCRYVREILCCHLDDLGAHRFREIARHLQIPLADVEAARAFVQHYLWPRPLDAAPAQTSSSSHAYSLPDVAIYEQHSGFVVEVLHSPRRILRLSPLYCDLARQARTLDQETRQHVQAHIARARTFLSNLRQRENSLQQISEAVVERQEAFLRHGVRHLAPLTRSEISAVTGLHESTVSRATAGKTVLLPNRHTMPFSDFFVAARGVQAVIRELIDNETTPLSDAELARLLAERGYSVARRTVAKYREQLQILPSTLR